MTAHVCIKTYLNRHEAELDRAFLDSSGIEALIHADDLGGMMPGLAFGAAGVSLLEAEEQAEEDLELLGSLPGTLPPG